jgi:hypothetical protein
MPTEVTSKQSSLLNSQLPQLIHQLMLLQQQQLQSMFLLPQMQLAISLRPNLMEVLPLMYFPKELEINARLDK